eukprot:TRINITY_DN13172_c0_g1_i1.p1 TRINITY_DN13172_c0_g1~~TRINITY_DN13172_c0_g1_i1.p1  ORF type:complete len:147 (+),score=23.87 TRINITY_DN13172_c0_g1_i1:186-626(+)
MTLYTLYIFNREGNCIFHKDFTNRERSISNEEDYKLWYGFIYSLKQFIKKTSPKPSDGSFNYFFTNSYKAHYYETPTMTKFILLTDKNTGDMQEVLKDVYIYYVEYVVKNPLYTMNDPIESELFNDKIDSFFSVTFSNNNNNNSRK